MKPTIIKWTYIALGFLILSNTINFLLHPLFIFGYSSFFDPILPTIITIDDGNSRNDYSPSDVSYLNYPISEVIIVVASIVAIIGLIKETPWSRIAAYVVIGIAAIEGIGMKIFFVLFDEVSITELLHTFIIFDLLLLCLTYKLFSSKPVRF